MFIIVSNVFYDVFGIVPSGFLNGCHSVPLCPRKMAFDAISALSDDEKPKDHPRPRPVQRRRASRGFRPKWEAAVDKSIPKKLRQTVDGKCGCQENCFGPFRTESNLYDRLLHLRQMLSQSPKLDQDREVS